jgi:threonine synthase
VSDTDLVAGIRLLAETTGIFTGTAGSVATAAAPPGENRTLGPTDEVVLA